eukprot:TRINITY_DN37515_c0_g1_i1.p1 TRINITY_DN37515_c0_g1~~TRINITY_DN37515_c0_g1_i1.p1  ORF type:complete len:130 (-),score=8.49 TRINITY_DN37515_c0_g1_i1:364-753(-)
MWGFCFENEETRRVISEHRADQTNRQVSRIDNLRYIGTAFWREVPILMFVAELLMRCVNSHFITNIIVKRQSLEATLVLELSQKTHFLCGLLQTLAFAPLGQALFSLTAPSLQGQRETIFLLNSKVITR